MASFLDYAGTARYSDAIDQAGGIFAWQYIQGAGRGAGIIQHFIDRFSPSWTIHAALSICFLISVLAIAPASRAQDASATGISVETNEEIFATLCALDAAGFNADESTLGDMPERLALRAELLKMQGPATEGVRRYYHQHAADPDQTLSRFIALALVLGPPPNFSIQMGLDALPPDAVALGDFRPLLAAFYQEAHLGTRWRRIEPEYEALTPGYRSVVRGVVVKTNAYLREVVRGSSGRTFTVYVDPLAGGRTNFRNLGDRYVVVVGSRQQESTDEIQHAYLHFVLDPMVLKNRDVLEKKKALLDVAAHAPQLSQEYRSDFASFVDECVIKSVELRLRNLPAAKVEEALKQDDESGFVLVRPLIAGLQKFEKDNPSMSYYLAEWLEGIDVDAERKRLQKVTFAAADTAPAAKDGAAVSAEPEGTDSLLAEGDRQLAARDPKGAAAAFSKVLSNEPDNLRALYGLALASVLSGKADESKTLFEKVVSKASAQPSSDPTIVAWSHVYLGRIDDLQGDRTQAIREYRSALTTDGAPDSARVAAQRGVDAAYAPPARQGGAPAQQP